MAAIAILTTVAAGAALAMLAKDTPTDPVAVPVPASMVAGTPGGQAVANASPTAHSTPDATPPRTPEATPEPTPLVTTAPSPAPPPPPPAATPPPATPAPTAVVVAAAGPADAVAAFYSNVAAGRFDAAYSLWSDRMRASYERIPNLDERFDQTASIDFEQLSVAEQDAATATVQANFVETYDGGSSERFVGFWRLVLVDGRWLLDEPEY